MRSFRFSSTRTFFVYSRCRTIVDGHGLMAVPLTAMMNDTMGDIQRDPPFQEVFCRGSSLRFGTSLDSNYVLGVSSVNRFPKLRWKSIRRHGRFLVPPRLLGVVSFFSSRYSMTNHYRDQWRRHANINFGHYGPQNTLIEIVISKLSRNRSHRRRSTAFALNAVLMCLNPLNPSRLLRAFLF